MVQNLPEVKRSGAGLPDNQTSMVFLEKVRRKAGLEDLYDARDITEVVFRTMRDMMPNRLVDQITASLTASQANTASSDNDLVELWQDTNKLVRWLSRVRQPLDIKDETFLFRISQEAGLSRGILPEVALEAVFSALKAELPREKSQEIAAILPGFIRQIWQGA
ncbi:MAG: DUF2267 domain-containing protein [Synechococcales cyanobacterium T60_A2020_003]|nr:DUF2267 domain-containing protein [Synechococcales cyanobacterium T60_A2020_003]